MKKLIIPLMLLLTVVLFSCNKNKDDFESSTYKIIAPSGTPQIALSFVDREKFNIEIVNGPDLLNSAFASGEFDLIVAPTNIGLKLHNEQYQILSTIIWGSLFIVSSTQINPYLNNISKIYAFGKGTTNDILLTYVIRQLDLNIEIVYLANAEEVRNHLVQEPTDIVILPEPQVTIVSNSLGVSLSSIDLSELFESVSHIKTPQASIFIKQSIDYKAKTKINNTLKEAVNQINVDYSASADKAIESGVTIPKPVLVSALPKMSINYVRGYEEKDDIQSYYYLIYDFNPNLVGSKPKDNFYF